ncbi:MAG: hypothetical protein M3Y59_19180 [Myxococcota bacterium]|nr:hypothetical protein [Myxococcota bacterium]
MVRQLVLFILALNVACAVAGRAASEPAGTPAPQATTASARGMLTTQYTAMLANLGPLPGQVVGLVMPADSKWGRSLEWIGEQVSLLPDSYVFPGDEKRGYQLYANDLAPRILRRAGSPLMPGKTGAWGLRAPAHLARVEFGGGYGISAASTYEAEATALRIVEGQADYPKSAEALMDAARAQFDRFVRDQGSDLDQVLAAEKAKFTVPGATAPSDARTTDTLFPLWDDGRKTLVVLFHRRVMRMIQGSLPCMRTYEGMPPEHSSMPYRYGYGVELGVKVEVAANGALSSLRYFTPAGLSIAPNVELQEEMGPQRICPGSPGLNRNYPVPQQVPELPADPSGEAVPSAKCGNGTRESRGGMDEACDQSDFGGATCAGLGFLGGALACTADCTTRTDSCVVAGSEARVLPSAILGEGAGLAVLEDGTLVVVATTHRGVEVTRFNDLLVPVGPKSTWMMAPGSDATVSTPVVAVVGKTLLIAVTRSGRSPETVLLRLGEDSNLVDTGTVIPGRALFLVGNGERALLGVYTQRRGPQLETLVVDVMGRPTGTPQVALTAPQTTGYVRGAAVATRAGWIASLGTNGTYFPAGLFAQIAMNGVPNRAGSIPTSLGQIAWARGPSSSFLVYTHPGGVLAAEVGDDGSVSKPVRLSAEPLSWMVAAAVKGRRIVAWASDYAKLRRYELDLDGAEPVATGVIEAPMYLPVAAVVAEDGGLRHVFQMSPARGGAMDGPMWLYRGP